MERPFASARAARRSRSPRRAWSRDALRAAHRLARRLRSRSSPITHHRRPDPGPAARRDRRQGAVDQGARPRARSTASTDFCGPFDEGCRDDPARRRSASPRCCPRGDVRDRLIGARVDRRAAAGRDVGTSSPRRAAQLLRLRPDLKIVPFRGNVETRLEEGRGRRGRCDPARRGGPRPARHRRRLRDPDRVMLPAPAQAAIGMECRTNDTRTQSVLSTVNNQITYSCVMAERAFTRALGATCASPVAAFCVLEDGDLAHARPAVQRGRQRHGRAARGVRLRRLRDAGRARARDAGEGARNRSGACSPAQ